MTTDERTASERAIEEVLAKYPSITESVLEYPSNSLTLLARQQSVKVGRTDLLFLAGEELLLIELKAERATESHIRQLREYRDHYESEVIGKKYPSASQLKPILLAPAIPASIKATCETDGLAAIEYDTGAVLQQFENQLFTGHAMFEKQPVSTGVDSLHLINGLIKYLGESTNPRTKNECVANLDAIAKEPGWNHPDDRMGQFIRLGIRLNLIHRVDKPPLPQVNQLRVLQDDPLMLTERGRTYYEALPDGPERVPPLNVDQAEILIELLYERPFYSDVTTGMVVFLDTVYDLSRSSDRVTSAALEEWYPRKAGKDWRGRSPETLVKWYGNYLDELGLITKVVPEESTTEGDYHYLTPEGANLLAYLQVDIGKEMIRGQTH